MKSKPFWRDANELTTVSSVDVSTKGECSCKYPPRKIYRTVCRVVYLLSGKSLYITKQNREWVVFCEDDSCPHFCMFSLIFPFPLLAPLGDLDRCRCNLDGDELLCKILALEPAPSASLAQSWSGPREFDFALTNHRCYSRFPSIFHQCQYIYL